MKIGKGIVRGHSLWKRKIHTGQNMMLYYLRHGCPVSRRYEVVLSLGTDVATSVPKACSRGFEFGMWGLFYATGVLKDKFLMFQLLGFELTIDWWQIKKLQE